jgi:peptidoglycan biosynthesis protein MviN/MurJ (putative lipid II flippase)
LFTLLGKLMSAAKEMAVAYRYGLAAEVDAYHFVYNLISWPLGIWCSVLTAVLVPLATRMRELDKEALPHFRSELFGFALLVGIAMALLGWLAVQTMLTLGGSGLPPDSAQFAQAALPGLILLLPLGMLVALQSAWMLSARRHVNTLLDSVPTFFIAAAILVFPSGDIGPLVWGTVAGSVFHLIALLVPAARRNELEAPIFTRASLQWRGFWQGFGIMLGGQALISFTVIIDQFYAVGLGTGSVATLGYANRVLSLILGLAAVAVSRATLPIFSQSRPDGAGGVHQVASYWARLMFVVGIAVMLVSYVMAPWVVKLLFERGQFLAADTMIVADALRYGLPQLPFYFSCMVLVSYALSQRRFKLIFWSGVIGCAGKIVGNLLLVPLLGINGIALGAIFIYGLNALFFWLSLRAPKKTSMAALDSSRRTNGLSSTMHLALKVLSSALRRPR